MLRFRRIPIVYRIIVFANGVEDVKTQPKVMLDFPGKFAEIPPPAAPFFMCGKKFVFLFFLGKSDMGSRF